MRWKELGDQPCSMSRTLAVVGDRWTLLILRDCFLGVRRFDAFERRIGLTRHLLADRLKKLVEHEVLVKVPYQQKPLREEYRLTDKGLALHPVILSLVSWGDTWMADERGAPIEHYHKGCGQRMKPVMVCSECAEPVGARDIEARPAAAFGEDAQRLVAGWSATD